MMLSAVIIDDEEAAIYVLADLLHNLSSIEIKVSGTAYNLEDGVEIIKETQPDIVFLDIDLPGRKGLDIYNFFKSPNFKVVFCTAYQQYAIDALRKSAIGYLLKPVDLIELEEIVKKVSEDLILEQKQYQFEDKINVLSTPNMSGENVILDVENGFVIGNTRNIEYCYAKNSFSVVVTFTKKEFFVTKSLKELQELLPENQFYRTHKSFLVNIYYIRKFVRSKENYVILESGIKIPVSVRITSVIANDLRKKLIV